MMKRFLPFAFLLGLVSCGSTGSVVLYDHTPSIPQPGYVSLNEDGSCWADEALYAQCPWTFDVRRPYGYYWSYAGNWYWHQDYRWRSVHRPPPRAWRHPPMIGREPHGSWRSGPPRHHRPPHRHRHVAPPARAR